MRIGNENIISDGEDEELFLYPDTGDLITAMMVDEVSDGNYWEESEKLVLQRSLEFCKRNQIFADGYAEYLDLGCGMGRLLSFFAPHMQNCIALEPDAERCAAAMNVANEINNVTVFNMNIAEYLDINHDSLFDVVLFSHVIQHMKHDTMRSLLQALSSCMERGGILILTTTYTDSYDNEYTIEHINSNCERKVDIVSERDFNCVMGRIGILPVCNFSRQWLDDELTQYGFDVVECLPFHFLGETDADVDEKLRTSTTALAHAKDAMYLCMRR